MRFFNPSVWLGDFADLVSAVIVDDGDLYGVRRTVYRQGAAELGSLIPRGVVPVVARHPADAADAVSGVRVGQDVLHALLDFGHVQLPRDEKAGLPEACDTDRGDSDHRGAGGADEPDGAAPARTCRDYRGELEATRRRFGRGVRWLGGELGMALDCVRRC